MRYSTFNHTANSVKGECNSTDVEAAGQLHLLPQQKRFHLLSGIAGATTVLLLVFCSALYVDRVGNVFTTENVPVAGAALRVQPEEKASSIANDKVPVTSKIKKDLGRLETKQQVTTEDVSLEPKSKPNFLFIMVDDLGWNSLGREDNDFNSVVPTFHKMAANGVTLTQYYSQELCTPARSALMTGRYPIRYGLQYNEISGYDEMGLNLTETLLPQVLKNNGYKTYALGKWNLGHYTPEYLPTARGFDEFLGYMTGFESYWTKLGVWFGFPDFMSADSECYGFYNDNTTYSMDIYTEQAVKTITEYHDFDAGPMYMYFASQAVHDPYYDEDSIHEGGMLPIETGSDEVYNSVMSSVKGVKRQQQALALYRLDSSVDKLLTAIDSVGQSDNTYVIVASDNGGCIHTGGRNGPLRGGKGSLFEGGTRVDALVYSPGLLHSVLTGSRYTGMMHVSDWFPTILDWAGISYTPTDEYFAFDGVSQATALAEGPSANQREYVLYNAYVNVADKDLSLDTGTVAAIRDSRYKLMYGYTGLNDTLWYDVTETYWNDDELDDIYEHCSNLLAMGDTDAFEYMLFDLDADISERVNLYDNPDYADVQGRLTSKLYEFADSAALTKELVTEYTASVEFWVANDGYIQPWVFPETSASAPKNCSKTTLYSYVQDK